MKHLKNINYVFNYFSFTLISPLRDHDDEEENDGASLKETTKAIQQILTSLNKLLPNTVKIKSDKKYVGISPTSSVKQLLVNISFEGSWLESPEPAKGSDTIGHWPISTQFPTSDKFFSPPACSGKVPLSVPYAFSDEDKEVENFLTAKSINQQNKMQLNDLFDKPDFPVKGNVHPIIDTLARKSILESGISDTLVSSSSDILDSILSDWDNAVGNVVVLRTYLVEVTKILSLARQCSWRDRSFVSALLVTNKLALRNLVLDGCGGAQSSKEVMKYSNFFSPSLFGEIPESLAKKVEASSHTYKAHIITVNTKDPKSSTPTFKRKNTSSYYNAPKRVAQLNFGKPNYSAKDNSSDFGKVDRDYRQQVFRGQKPFNQKGNQKNNRGGKR